MVRAVAALGSVVLAWIVLALGVRLAYPDDRIVRQPYTTTYDKPPTDE